MLIYHFLLALIMAVIVMPRTPTSLDKLTHRIVEEYEQEPTYLINMDGATYTLDPSSTRMINARWIDKLELLKPEVLPENKPVVGELVFRLHFKKRKKENFRMVLQQSNTAELPAP